jgi:hypothetical protein
MTADRAAQKHFSRWLSAQDREHKRTTTHLIGPDVIGSCVNCAGPIFTQSSNSQKVAGLPWRQHVRCPR